MRAPWLCLDNSSEQYSLLYEREHLTEMGQGIDYLLNAVMTGAATEALKYTVLSGKLLSY